MTSSMPRVGSDYKPMKVIIVSDYAMVNGGAGKVALESANALADVVEHVTIFASIGEPASFLLDKPNLAVLSLGQKKVTEQSLHRSIIGGLWNKEAQRRFSKLLDSHDPKDTVIHIHSWRDGLTLSFMPTILKRGFKFVFTVHDYGLACPLAGFYNHRTKQICTHKGLSSKCIQTRCTEGSFLKKNWFVARHFLQVHRAHMPARLKHLIVIGATTKRVMEPYLNADTTVHMVPNFTDVAPGKRIQAERNRTYAYVGRFSPEKDPVTAALATHLTGVPIMFIGTGPLVDEIRFANPEAEMRGWRKSSEVKELLTTARGIIFPSVWYEGQPLVIDEAAALGLPVIVTSSSAAKDAVESYRHGLTFEAGNVDALVRRIKEFEHDDVVESFSRAGFENFWRNPTTMNAHVQTLLKVYEEVLSDLSSTI